MSTFFAIAHFVITAYLGVAMVALTVMMMTIVVDVFMRYTFNAPVVGAFDVVEICLVVAVFYSMGAAISGIHEIVIDLVDQAVPPNVVRLLCRIEGLLSAAILLFIFISMLPPAMQSYEYGEFRLELKIPVWIVWEITLVGMCGGLLALVLNVLRSPCTGVVYPQTAFRAS